jgi:hypothetical protein
VHVKLQLLHISFLDLGPPCEVYQEKKVARFHKPVPTSSTVPVPGTVPGTKIYRGQRRKGRTESVLIYYPLVLYINVQNLNLFPVWLILNDLKSVRRNNTGNSTGTYLIVLNSATIKKVKTKISSFQLSLKSNGFQSCWFGQPRITTVNLYFDKKPIK